MLACYLCLTSLKDDVMHTTNLQSNVRLKMYGLAYLSEAWPVSGGVLHTDGNVSKAMFCSLVSSTCPTLLQGMHLCWQLTSFCPCCPCSCYYNRKHQSQTGSTTGSMTLPSFHQIRPHSHRQSRYVTDIDRSNAGQHPTYCANPLCCLCSCPGLNKP
jgi:hypothetical protein